MFYRLLVVSLIIWLPLHIYHFRGAQLAYMALIALVIAYMILQHLTAGLAHVLSTHVLGEEANVMDTHLAWYRTSTRGGCGRACMIVVELAAGFSIMRLLFLHRVVKTAAVQSGGVSTSSTSMSLKQQLSAWPVEPQPQQQQQLQAATGSSVPVPTFLRILSGTDTVIDSVLQRSALIPMLICALYNIAPSFAINLIITDVVIIARGVLIWWVQHRRRVTQGNTAPSSVVSSTGGGAAPKRSAAGVRFHQLISRYCSENTLIFVLPVLVLLHTYALVIGVGLMLILQLHMELKDWGPHDHSNLCIRVGLAAHTLIQTVCLVRVCGEGVKRMVMGGNPRKPTAATTATAPTAGIAVSASDSSRHHHRVVVVNSDKVHVS